MDWWLIGLTVVIGAAALTFAASVDRNRRQQREAAVASPPARHVPTLDPEAPAPQYVPQEVALRPKAAPVETPAGISSAVPKAAELAGGWADPTFVTDHASGWAVVSHPLVLTCTGVGSFRELLPAITAAKRSQRPLVVVAPAIEGDAVRTLAANAAQGLLAGVAVLCPDLDAVSAIATSVGATVVQRSDLQGGWVPPAAYGECDVWVSARQTSWALVDLDQGPQLEGST